MTGPSPTILPVILCGGAGTRLWPVSTQAAPKPFHALMAAESLFQQTIRRVAGAPGEGFLAPMIVCGRMHRDLVEQQMAAVGIAPSALVLEPCGRGTAPIAAIAAAIAKEDHPSALVLLLSADHLITDEQEFRRTIRRAAAVAGERIAVLGIAPTRPETGYGYIASGARLSDGVYAVDRFVEKPDLASAQSFVASGDHSWNAGVFLFSPALMLREMKASRPDILDGALAALPSPRSGPIVELDDARFQDCPAEALDRAVMEHTSHAAVATCAFEWADIGAWDEVWRLTPHDADGNAFHGDVAAADIDGCLVWSTGPAIAALGVSDLVIVATADGVLVAPRSRAQEVRALAERIAAGRLNKT